jgi:putative transposase
MHLTPYTTLTWAYQLHYYLCFRTHRRKQVFTSPAVEKRLADLLAEIATNHDYHLLECRSYSSQLRCLLSLRPSHAVAKVVQVLKCNSARELPFSIPLWARGYAARSTGRVRTSAVRAYLEKQATHHGYANRVLPPIYKYRAQTPVILSADHACFDLSHHLVLSTKHRKGVFTSTVGAALTDYWLRVAWKRNFAIDQISIVPDHLHMIVRIVPKASIEEVTLLLMNNGQYFIAKRYPQLMMMSDMDQLWNPSAYVGTCGDLTTGLIKKWLSSDE